MLAALCALAADSKTVSHKSGAETVEGVLYTPAGNGPFPVIIVIHEWWGLQDRVKEQAARLAGQGCVALAIDLYRGQVARQFGDGPRAVAWSAGRPRPRDPRAPLNSWPRSPT